MAVRRESAETRRRRLLEAALSAIARRGLDGCSIAAITKAAGVSTARGLVHHHFRNKDEFRSRRHTARSART